MTAENGAGTGPERGRNVPGWAVFTPLKPGDFRGNQGHYRIFSRDSFIYIAKNEIKTRCVNMGSLRRFGNGDRGEEGAFRVIALLLHNASEAVMQYSLSGGQKFIAADRREALLRHYRVKLGNVGELGGYF